MYNNFNQQFTSLTSQVESNINNLIQLAVQSDGHRQQLTGLAAEAFWHFNLLGNQSNENATKMKMMQEQLDDKERDIQGLVIQFVSSSEGL